MMLSVNWYTTEDFEKEDNKKELCSMGLIQWANILNGNIPPSDFGEGLAIVGRKLGVSSTEQGLSEYADDYILNSS